MMDFYDFICIFIQCFRTEGIDTLALFTVFIYFMFSLTHIRHKRKSVLNYHIIHETMQHAYFSMG